MTMHAPPPDSRPLRVGIAGLGTVGAAVATILKRQENALAARCGRPVRVTAVSARDRNRDRGIDISGMSWFDDPVALAASPEIDCLIELIGGALVMLGFYSRIAAFICSGEMAFAYFIGHFPKSPLPVVNGGLEAILFCFVFLYLAVAGPGPWAINRK